MNGRITEVEVIDCHVTDKVFEWKKQRVIRLSYYQGCPTHRHGLHAAQDG